MKVDKRIIAMGVGAGVGAIVSPVLKKWVEPMIGAQIPYLDALGVWGTWHVFVPLVSGGALVAVTMFTDLISRKNETANDVLAMYGFAALFSGIIQGATESLSMSTRRAAPVMAMGNRPVARVAPRAYVANGGGGQTPVRISSGTIIS